MNNNAFFQLISDFSQSIFNNKIFFQITNSLSQVILLILFLSWITKKFLYFKIYKKNFLLKIRDKISVGPRASIIVMEVQDVRLVLGITEKNISYLYVLPPCLKEKVFDKQEKVFDKQEKVFDNVK